MAACPERSSHTYGFGSEERAHLLEGVHPQGDAHPRAVGEESGKGRLFEEAEY